MSTENLKPSQLTDYDNAVELANMAKDAFDRRHKAATDLAKLHTVPRLGRRAPETAKAKMAAASKARAGFIRADQDFHLYDKAVETLMPSREAFEPEFAPKRDESLASETVWAAMSEKQRLIAVDMREAIAAGPLKEKGVTEDTLRVVMSEVDGKQIFGLIHTGAGVDIGDPKKEYDPARSYKAVMSEKNDTLFQIELGGATYDTRGITDPLYSSKVADTRERGVTLPDSKPLAEETDDLWTWTMLPGEPLTADGLVQLRNVLDGRVGSDLSSPEDGDRYLRVCPAVVIPEI